MNDEPSTVDERAAPGPVPTGGRVDFTDVVRFADFEFDFKRDQLRRNGVLIALSPKPSALLRFLLANSQRLVSKDELMASLWAGVVVTDDSLVQCVRELRSRLGEQGPKLITTLPRRGYIFEAEVRPGALGGREDIQGPAASGASQSAVTVAPKAVAPRRARRVLALALAMGVFAIAGGAIYMRAAPAPFRIDEELARRYSVVVTPFQDIGNVPAPKILRDGLVDEIASQLSQRQNAIVIRSSSPVGARYAMSGSVIARGDGVAVDVLVKTVPDGVVVWAEHYDYPDGSDPAINVDIALRATSGLRLRFFERHKARVSAPGYRFDPADLAFSGWDDIDSRQTAQDVIRGKARFEEALRADSESVVALTGLASALMSERYGYSGEPKPQDVAESERVAAKAISIAPNDPAALINWANVLLFRGQPALALPFYEKAMRRAPANANAHLRYAYALLIAGRMQEVQPQIDDALRIGHRDARNVVSAYALAASAAFVGGDDEKAYALALRAVAERPTFGNPYAMLASIDSLHGRAADAAMNMAEHRRLMPHNTIERYIANNPSGSDRYLAGRTRMVEGLRAAGLPEH